MRLSLICLVVIALAGVTGSSSRAEAAGACAQPVSSGIKPVATDCLVILNVAVGLETCSPECICAPKGSLPTSATDALVCLNVSVGIDLPLNCPCEVTTTTTLSSTTTTTTSTVTSSTTTTTSSSTTSTTLTGDIGRGQAKYDSVCTYCHSAIPHDLIAEFAPDLGGKGDLLVLDLGTINEEMDDVVLTEQELADLAAFLDSL